MHTTEQLERWLEVWRRMKHLYETHQYGLAVHEFGAAMVAHHTIDSINTAIWNVQVELERRRSNGTR